MKKNAISPIVVNLHDTIIFHEKNAIGSLVVKSNN